MLRQLILATTVFAALSAQTTFAQTSRGPTIFTIHANIPGTIARGDSITWYTSTSQAACADLTKTREAKEKGAIEIDRTTVADNAQITELQHYLGKATPLTCIKVVYTYQGKTGSTGPIALISKNNHYVSATPNDITINFQ